jgi:hypothetical protein
MTSEVQRFGLRHLGALMVGTALIMLAVVPVSAGNNGTLKIHEGGTPLGTSDNDPKVACSFDVEAFDLDSGQTGMLVLSSQGDPTTPDVGPVPFGPANGDGYAITGFNDVPSGHYEATLYGKDGDQAVKAKSKVFKVTCEGGGGGGGRGGGGG